MKYEDIRNQIDTLITMALEKSVPIPGVSEITPQVITTAMMRVFVSCAIALGSDEEQIIENVRDAVAKHLPEQTTPTN